MITKIAVLGAGTMGHGMAETFAMHKYEVNLYDISKDKLNQAKDEIREELILLIEQKFFPADELEATINRINFISSLQDSVQGCDYVIEATPENLEVKQQLFKQLDQYCTAHTILASNTSSFELHKMLKFVSGERKQQIMINHWYNPAHLMPLVELSYFGDIKQFVYEEVENLYHSINKQTVKVLKDIPGLIANRIQQGIAREVFSLMEMGAVDAENADKALRYGPGFRYATTGQLEICDLGGLDVWCVVGDNLLSVMDNSSEANSLLREKVNEGKLGIKSNEGFYDYRHADIQAIKTEFAKRLIHQLKASDYYEGSLGK
ncbi:3-hydroxyacyl-CoA dehydrogenase family protein [Salsuginibacillus kocurii]|uniref:3-hydroxyacyl-CoA dehydrogenase family protein n=1 Tax=Salsuginibacillus kocurii TaxID=427078 RepID=UPI00036DA831|nr:3-hydroxyacyl-CoA dehydrogenase family protein [Salsuginibacillus kocurii]